MALGLFLVAISPWSAFTVVKKSERPVPFGQAEIMSISDDFRNSMLIPVGLFVPLLPAKPENKSHFWAVFGVLPMGQHILPL